MSLKEALFDFIDNISLPAIFSRKPENLKELRQPLLKGIANTKRQFEAGQTRAPHRWWKLSNDVVALTVKVGGNAFTINGTETNHIPADRFVDFLDKFNSAVDAGEFDDELRHKGSGDATVKIPAAKRTTTKAAKPAKAAKPPQAVEAAPQPVAQAAVEEQPAKIAPPVKKTTRAKTATKPSEAKPKPKRKTADAKTLHARALKSAATRAANKAKLEAEPATPEDGA